MGTPRETAFQQACEKWPGVVLDYDAWGTHLDGLGWPGELPATFASMFLCCACALGDATARRSFEEVYLSSLRAVVARQNADEEFVDWAMQSARQALLSGPSPKIASYDGRRPLADWLRVVVQRIALAQRLADRGVAPAAPVPPADVRRFREAQ
jgi:RNA polymerase sigma-70 factor, ECF subfamily